MDDLIQACGELSDAMAPMPTDVVLVGTISRHDRIRAFAVSLFEWWEQLGPGWDHLQVDRRTLPRVDEWLIDVGQRHRELAAAALQTDIDAAATRLLTAITTNDAWRSLRDAGMDSRQAALQVSRLFGVEAEGPQPLTTKPEALH